MNKGKRFMLIMLSIVMFLGNIPIESMAASIPDGVEVNEKGVVLVGPNNTAEALMKSGKYKGYLDDTIFGLAGNFMFTGFKSVDSAGHYAGNVLTKKFTYSGDLGQGFYKQFSYVKEDIIGSSIAMTNNNDQYLVLGKDMSIDLKGDYWHVNGKQINKPNKENGSKNQLWQDGDEEVFIDFEKLQLDMGNLSKRFAKFDGDDVRLITDQNDPEKQGFGGEWSVLKIENKNKDFVTYNIDGDSGVLSKSPLGIKLNKANQALLINIDAKGKKTINLPAINYIAPGKNLDLNGNFTEPIPGNIIINVFDSTKVDGLFSGEINTDGSRLSHFFLLAPNGKVDIRKQFQGLVIADEIKANGEEHHRDKPTIPPVEKIEIPVSKKWVDENEKDISGDVKVEKVIIQLFEEGKEGVIKTLELTKENDWKGTFKDLPKYKEGTKEEIKYVVKEVKIDGYNTVISGGIEEGFVVTNTKAQEPVEFMDMSIEKNWEDEKGNKLDKILDADGKEVKEIILELTSSETGSKVRNITLKAANNWKFEIDKLPKIDKVTGNKIKYSLEEISMIKGFKLKEIKDNSDEVKFDFDLVNKRDIPVEIINIPVNKMWLVKDESTIADNIVEVRLLENGVFNNKTLELTKANNWKGEFKNLPVKDASGKDIVYTIEEIDIPGFDKGMGGNQGTGFTLINAERPVEPPIELRNIPVEKLWKVKDEETIKDKVVGVKLLENGVFNGKILKLTKANNWKGEFKNLPVKDVVYTVEEINIPGFDKGHGGNQETGFTLINAERPVDPPVEVKINIPVQKIWKVKDEKTIKDKVVEVKLLENGVFNGKILKLTKANNWKGEFKDLPVKNTDGENIVYTIEEIDIPGFDKGHGGNQEVGFTLINAERPVDPPVELRNIPVRKMWKVKDETTIAGKVVEVKLLENGIFNGKTLKLTKGNDWKAEFKNLPVKNSSGKDIKYTVEEVSIPGFDKGIGGNQEQGFVLINAEKPIKPDEPDPGKPIEPGEPRLDIRVSKRWEDKSGKLIDGKDVDKIIEVKLYANGVEIDSIKLDKAKGWIHVFKDLPKKNKNGDTIEYRVEEGYLPGYKVEVKENALGFEIINREEPDNPKPIKPDEPDTVKPIKPVEPVTPTIPVGPNPEKPIKPVKPIEPIEKTPKGKNPNPQTYRGGILLTGVELVSILALILYLRKRRNKYPAK